MKMCSMPYFVRNGGLIISHSYDDVESQHYADDEPIKYGLCEVDGKACRITEAFPSKDAFMVEVKNRYGLDLSIEWANKDAHYFDVVAQPTPDIQKISIFLDHWSPTEAIACIKVGHNSEFILAGGTDSNASKACLDAAKALREAARRFELLASEDCPYNDNVHARINAIALS